MKSGGSGEVQELRYAIIRQIQNFLQDLVAKSQEGEQIVGLGLPVLAQQFSWMDEIDAWRTQDYRAKQIGAQIALPVVSTVTGTLGAAMGPAFIAAMAGTAAAVSGGIAAFLGAWVGSTSLWMDGKSQASGRVALRLLRYVYHRSRNICNIAHAEQSNFIDNLRFLRAPNDEHRIE